MNLPYDCARRGLSLAATIALICTIAAGCAPTADSSNSISPAPDAPHKIESLSALSADSIDSMSSARPQAPSGAASLLSQNAAQRAILDAPGRYRPVGNDLNPGRLMLLNDKAAEFPVFSNQLLDHLYSAIRKREAADEFRHLRLPNGLRPVVVTAILDKSGKLRELVLEQHSGKTVVDDTVIDACKYALFYDNPPKDALSGNGDYEARFEVSIEIFASDGKSSTFATDMGLALL
ncbi:MAG TPA: hypothetical protein VIX12_00105 [Candidatus Binataceae bacterium]